MVKRPFAIEAAISGAGSVTKLAEALGVSVGAIYQWEAVPPLRVLTIEKLTGVPRWVLRPDMYPPLDEKPYGSTQPDYTSIVTQDGLVIIRDTKSGRTATGRNLEEALAELRRLETVGAAA